MCTFIYLTLSLLGLAYMPPLFITLIYLGEKNSLMRFLAVRMMKEAYPALREYVQHLVLVILVHILLPPLG